jgi:hypothetical protein
MFQQTKEAIKLEDILADWIKGFPHYYVNKAFTPQCSCHKNMHFNANIICHCHQDGTKWRPIEITILEDVLQIYHSGSNDAVGWYTLLYASSPHFFTELEALLPQVCIVNRK